VYVIQAFLDQRRDGTPAAPDDGADHGDPAAAKDVLVRRTGTEN
jgi:hypothetical protein